MAWLEEEDAALKRLFNSITVVDKKNAARTVQVWFGKPDPEVRPVTWPHIVIDLIDLTEASERRMVSNPQVYEYYRPPGMGEPAFNQRVTSTLGQPYNIDYQVTTWARIPQHDRQLLAHILTDELPYRFGQVAEDVTGTNRRLELIGFRKADFYENDKRVFRNIFTARMSSELFLTPASLARIVDSVHITADPANPDLFPVF